MLRRHPGFAGLAIGVLALGIAVNTAMFAVINAALLQPLQLPDPDRLVLLSISPRDIDFANGGLEEQVYLDVRAGDHLLDGIATFTSRQASLTGAGEPVPIGLGTVTPEFFSVLGVRPALGRAFRGGDERATDDNVVLLSDWLWRTRFGARPDIIGATVTVDRVPRRIIGVMPPHAGPLWQQDAWIPLEIRVDPAFSQGRTVIGRLKKTASIPELRDELTALATPGMTQLGAAPTDWVASVVRAKEYYVGDARRLLWMLAGAVGFVLLIACSNVASLCLARAEERSRELAVRAALGAGRGRLVRQLLTESVVVSLVGGLLGLLATVLGVRVLVAAVEEGNLTLVSPVRIDMTVAAFTCGLSILAGVVFGVAPAFGSRRSVGAIAGGRTATRAHGRLHAFLVIAEVALALVLLSGASMLTKSLLRMRSVDTGFSTNHLATVSFDLPSASYRSIEDLRAFQDAMLERLRAIEGVRRAAAVSAVPFGGNMFAGQFTLKDGRQWPQDEMAYKQYVTPAYFDAMGIRMRAGRSFSDRDRVGAPGVVVVSASVAQEFWPGKSAVGQEISGSDHPAAADWLTIVGVVDDVKQSSPREEHALAIYRPYAQATQASVTVQPPLGSQLTFVMRTAPPAYEIASAVRTAVRGVDKDLPVPVVQSMDDLIARATATPEFQSRLLSAFAALGLVMTVVGLYGVLTYSVSRRMREFGIRMALGADRVRLIRRVVNESLGLAAAGIAIGAAGAFVVMRALRDFLFGVTPADPPTFLGVSFLLVIVAVGAAALPARRASRVDPAVTLRAE